MAKLWCLASVWCVAILAGGCGGDGGTAAPTPAPITPAGGLLATIQMGSESFEVLVTHPDGMNQARAVWAGTSAANIPVGDLVCSAQPWNAPWTWHMEPETVRFAEVTIEVCDGEPSYVEANCPTFGAGRYCPWAAEMVELRDCTVDSSCPAVPR
jgi:hypothetical protein